MDCMLAERSDYLATEEDKTTRILPLIKTTSLSGGSYRSRDVPDVPARPRETLMDGEEEMGGVNGSNESLLCHDNKGFEHEEHPEVQPGSAGTCSIETDVDEDVDTKLWILRV